MKFIAPLHRTTRWLALPALAGAGLAALGSFADAADDVAKGEPPPLIRVGYSHSLFREINENDARAAMKVYTQMIAEQHGVSTGSGPVILEGTDAMTQALRLGQIEVLSLTTPEFVALEHLGLEGPLLVTTINQRWTEEYLLLVREAGAVHQVEDLSGRTVIVSSDVRASLAEIWLEVLMTEHGLGPAGKAWPKVLHAAKATLVVLPVFFGREEACVITRNSWNVMVEMNPQLKKQLKILAISPPVLPAMTGFRRGFAESARQRVLAAAENSVRHPSFRQLTALFKTESLTAVPVAELTSARTLLATHHRLCAPAPEATAPAPSVGSAPAGGAR